MASLDDVADTLYALKPDEFSSARDAAVKEARSSGDKELAREIGQLRKPTQSAWLINLLWRDQHDVMEQLFELANELSNAQAGAAGQELRSLTAQRRQLESALLRRATELARQEGVNVSESTEREAQETLSAALAVPEVADDVRSGRLVKAASYAGFGALPGAQTTRPTPTRAPAKAPPQVATKAPIDLRTAREEREGREAAEREQREREAAERREAAQRRIEQAQRAAEAANAQLERATRTQREARSRRDDLRQQLRALREQVQRVETEVEQAEHQTENAERERDEAESAHSVALKQLADAERALRE